jgi:hypothetical protein
MRSGGRGARGRWGQRQAPPETEHLLVRGKKNQEKLKKDREKRDAERRERRDKEDAEREKHEAERRERRREAEKRDEADRKEREELRKKREKEREEEMEQRRAERYARLQGSGIWVLHCGIRDRTPTIDTLAHTCTHTPKHITSCLDTQVRRDANGYAYAFTCTCIPQHIRTCSGPAPTPTPCTNNLMVRRVVQPTALGLETCA